MWLVYLNFKTQVLFLRLFHFPKLNTRLERPDKVRCFQHLLQDDAQVCCFSLTGDRGFFVQGQSGHLRNTRPIFPQTYLSTITIIDFFHIHIPLKNNIFLYYVYLNLH